MIKPYIVCHMMTSVDGRIDCAMTEHLPGVQEYYDTLDALDAPTRISGRVTAELEMALPGKFEDKTAEALGMARKRTAGSATSPWRFRGRSAKTSGANRSATRSMRSSDLAAWAFSDRFCAAASCKTAAHRI